MARTPDVAAAVSAVFTAFSSVEEQATKLLFEAVESAQEDLASVMETVRAINATKAAQRDVLNRMQRVQAANAHRSFDDCELTFPPDGVGSAADFRKLRLPVLDVGARTGFRLVPHDPTSRGDVTKADVDALVEKIKALLDSMSEMGEMESLRLQMYMDRLSKLMSTLSNILKKISDTASAITQNIK